MGTTRLSTTSPHLRILSDLFIIFVLANQNHKRMGTVQNYDNYRKDYSDNLFWEKLKRVATKAGVKLVYAALLLYYVLKSPGTPGKDRLKILGALGYLILPTDLVPDFIPVAGYADDLAALTWAIYSVAKNITPEIKLQAQDKLGDWFKDYDPKDLEGLF